MRSLAAPPIVPKAATRAAPRGPSSQGLTEELVRRSTCCAAELRDITQPRFDLKSANDAETSLLVARGDDRGHNVVQQSPAKISHGCIACAVQFGHSGIGKSTAVVRLIND